MTIRKFHGQFGLLALVVSSCAVGPDFVPPDPAAPDTFTARDQRLERVTPEIAWWAAFDDPHLNQLVMNAIDANYDLRIARSNVLLARAVLGEGKLDRYPTVTISGAVNRWKSSEAVSVPGTADPVTVWDGGFDASWELDFFGRVRRSVEVLAADYNAAIAEQRNVIVIVTAEVARNYIELRGLQLRLVVARQNAANQEQTFRLTQALLDGGRGTQLDIARAQSQFEATMATIPALEAGVARSIHRLGVLVGELPATLYAELEPTKALPSSPDTVHIGDPATLLRRRPDVAAAEYQLAAATARIGVATADLFPRITVIGSAGFTSQDESVFGSSSSRRFAIGPFLSWPAFDLGRVRERISAAEAGSDIQFAIYERTVSLALEETENSLVSFSRAREREERLRVAAEASESAADLARLRYRNGADSFLSVLDAERRVLELQDQLASSRIDSIRNLIAIYKALGGAWQFQSGTEEAVSQQNFE
jgi:multidrug efflux system outer membrane protein